MVCVADPVRDSLAVVPGVLESPVTYDHDDTLGDDKRLRNH